MHWLANNYLWLLSVAIVPALGFLLKHYVFTEQAGTTLAARDSEVSGSPVIGGTGNVTHINYGLTPAAPATSVPATATPTLQTRLRSNIQMTGTRHVMLMDMGHGVMSEHPNGGSEALLVRFTNEPKAGVVGGPVMASLAYETDDPVDERIIGAWIDTGDDIVRFRVDDSHNLLAGFIYEGKFITLGRRHVQGTLRTEIYFLNNARAVRVRLTDANDGFVIYEGRFRVTLNPLGIVPEINGHAETA